MPDDGVMGHHWAQPIPIKPVPVLLENAVGYYFENITSRTASCLRKLMAFVLKRWHYLSTVIY